MELMLFTCARSIHINTDRKELKQVLHFRFSFNRPDRVAQLAENWASIPKVVGSIPTVVRHIFQACPVWIYTQSNITIMIFIKLTASIWKLEHSGVGYLR